MKKHHAVAFGLLFAALVYCPAVAAQLKYVRRPAPTNIPVFLKTTLDISCETESHYWKTPGGPINSNWIPKVKFYVLLSQATRAGSSQRRKSGSSFARRVEWCSR